MLCASYASGSEEVSVDGVSETSIADQHLPLEKVRRERVRID